MARPRPKEGRSLSQDPREPVAVKSRAWISQLLMNPFATKPMTRRSQHPFFLMRGFVQFLPCMGFMITGGKLHVKALISLNLVGRGRREARNMNVVGL